MCGPLKCPPTSLSSSLTVLSWSCVGDAADDGRRRVRRWAANADGGSDRFDGQRIRLCRPCDGRRSTRDGRRWIPHSPPRSSGGRLEREAGGALPCPPPRGSSGGRRGGHCRRGGRRGGREWRPWPHHGRIRAPPTMTRRRRRQAGVAPPAPRARALGGSALPSPPTRRRRRRPGEDPLDSRVFVFSF